MAACIEHFDMRPHCKIVSWRVWYIRLQEDIAEALTAHHISYLHYLAVSKSLSLQIDSLSLNIYSLY